LALPGWQAVGRSGQVRKAVIDIANEQPPRRRFIAGADSITSTEHKVAELQADIDLNRQRFVSLDISE
jgi:hypothetical protein